jgi:hypothetical protein
MNSLRGGLRLAAAAVVVTGGLIVASCGGGSVQTTPVLQSTSAPGTQSIPTGGGSLTFASSTSQVATMGFAAGAPAGTTISATSSTTAPSNAPAVTSLKRATESVVVGGVPFFYVTFSVSANLSAQYIASETVTTTSSQPANATYGAEFADITSSPATSLGDAGPATSVNGLVTLLNGTNTNPPTLQAGHTYLIMFFYVPSGTVQPSPSPTATATSGTQAAFPCGSAPPSASGTLSNFVTGSPIPYPALGSCNANITFGSGTTIAPGTQISVTTSLALPSGAPTALPTNSNGGGAPKGTLVFETLNVTAGSITVPVGATASPVQTVTIASTGTCSTYGQSFTSTGQPWQGTSSGTLSGLTVTFPAGQSSQTTTLNTAGSPYFIAYLCY